MLNVRDTLDTAPNPAGTNGTGCSSGQGTEWREGMGEKERGGEGRGGRGERRGGKGKGWMTWLDTLSIAVH